MIFVKQWLSTAQHAESPATLDLTTPRNILGTQHKYVTLLPVLHDSTLSDSVSDSVYA